MPAKSSPDGAHSKVPEVTITFWIVKIAATTLGETAGDTVSMTMNLGYLAATAIFASLLVLLVCWQMATRRFHPFLYWAAIIASTTAGTTMADFADRSLGIGYLGGSIILLACLLGALAAWYWTLGSISVRSVRATKAEAFYWLTITVSQTLGTALGDWIADSGLGYERGSFVIAAVLLVVVMYILADQHFARPAVLGGIHSDTAARRDARRLVRQAGREWRVRLQPPAGFDRARAVHSDMFARPAAARVRAGRGTLIIQGKVSSLSS